MTEVAPEIPIDRKMSWIPRDESKELIEIYKSNFQSYCRKSPTKQNYTAPILNGNAGTFFK